MHFFTLFKNLLVSYVKKYKILILIGLLVYISLYYLNIKEDKPDILSQDFYKIWELIFLIDLLNSNNMDIKIIANDDDYNVIENTILKFKQKLLSIDINLKKNKTNYNLIIASEKYNINEGDNYKLFFNEIVIALQTQQKDGSFVVKIGETFTIPTLKLIYLLSCLYEETYIYKPSFSRLNENEKYIVCKKYKKIDIKIKPLEKILEEMNTKHYCQDIFPSLMLPFEFIAKFKFINTKLVNMQYVMTNKMITYIKENNYFGEKYHIYKEAQIVATKWWVSNYYPPSNNLYEKNKTDLKLLFNDNLKYYQAESEKFILTLIY